MHQADLRKNSQAAYLGVRHMKSIKHILFLLFLILATNCFGDTEHLTVNLSTVLAYGEEIADSTNINGNYFIRIYRVPLVNGECWGEISSCPDVQLLVSVHEGDLHEEPAMHTIPTAKGWKFGKWISNELSGAIFQVETTIPEANIEDVERQKWKADVYQITVTMDSIKYKKLN